MIKGAEIRPTVVVMEDLHWADTSSLEMLEALYRLAEKHRIAFINVYRPGYFESDDGKVAKTGQILSDSFVEIEIQPLDNDSAESLIDNMLAIKGLPHTVKHQIVEQAGGNPFFIEEVVRSLIDEGAVVKRDGGFEVTEKIEKVLIPSTINDVLMARIDRLEQQTRELVKVASVIGRSFFDRIIKDVADSIEDVDHRLEYLKDVQLIRDRTRMQELEYLFKHALAQEAAYESTLLQQRKQLHLKVAESIERIFKDRLHEFYGILALHYSKADNYEKAEDYMVKAGEEALRSSASSEALGYFQKALELYIDKHGEATDPERLDAFEKNVALAFHNKAQWANAVIYFDRLLKRRGLFSPRNKLIIALKLTSNFFVVAMNLYLASNKSRRAPTKKDEEIFELSFKRIQALAYVDSIRLFTETVAIAGESCHFDITRSSWGTQVWLAMSGVVSHSGVWFNLSKRILERTKDTINRGDIRVRSAYVMMDAQLHHCKGTWDAMEDYDEPLIDLSLKRGDLWNVTGYIWFFGMVRNEQGDFKTVELLIRKLAEIGDIYDYDLARLFHHNLKAFLLTRMRKLHDARLEADVGISYTRQRSLDLQHLMFLGQKVQILFFLKDVEEAIDVLSKGKELISLQCVTPPLFACQFLVGQFLGDIHSLAEATDSNCHSHISQLLKRASQSGKAALRNSRKYAPYRTKIFRLMGRYYWLIGKQLKALKWWDKSIKEGERLGARPDLSRTYFEVGKRLLEPQSKYKQLNGIDAKGYLEKAEILFKDMGLEKDLDDLERVRSQI